MIDVDTTASQVALEELWQSVLERSPVYATLRRCAELRLDLRPVS